MGSPVILTPQAEEDLEQICEYIARDNVDRARSYRDELVRKAQGIGAHPMMGRVVPGQPDPCVREIVHGAYRVIYEVFDDPLRIFILRFWHGARGNPQIVED